MAGRNVIRGSDPEMPSRSGLAARVIRSTERSAPDDPHKHRNAAERRRMVILWSVLMTVVTTAVIGGFMWFWLRSHAGRKSDGDTGGREVRIAAKFATPGEDEALDLVKRALATRDPGRVAATFHLGGATASEVVEFLEAREKQDGRIDQYIWLSSIDADGLQLEAVLVLYGTSVYAERLVFLTPDEQGRWKVDFDAYARVSRPPWQELLEGRVDASEVRVIMGRDAYYNGRFADDDEWTCYAMVSLETNKLLPEGKEILYGYCRKDSAQAKALARMFVEGVRTRRATIIIHRPSLDSPRQFEIRRVLSEDWVVGPQAYDEKFQ